jgi:hypothetical protein
MSAAVIDVDAAVCGQSQPKKEKNKNKKELFTLFLVLAQR